MLDTIEKLSFIFRTSQQSNNSLSESLILIKCLNSSLSLTIVTDSSKKGHRNIFILLYQLYLYPTGWAGAISSII